MKYVLVKFWVGVVANHYNTCTAHPMLLYDRDDNVMLVNTRYFCSVTGGLRRVGDVLMRHFVKYTTSAYSYKSDVRKVYDAEMMYFRDQVCRSVHSPCIL